jgi:PTH1 family peptidyl-tRNA hydrolase
MLLLCGLGNVGKQYSNTRHNAGFLFLQSLTQEWDLSFKNFKHLHCEIAKAFLQDVEILCIKPATFMNNSGTAILSTMQYYKIDKSELLVVHDDIDLPLGSIKVKFGGGSAGHNGIKSIDSVLGNQYWRMRIGIGRPDQDASVLDYVLGNFSNDELVQIEEVMSNCKKHFADFVLKAKSNSK